MLTVSMILDLKILLPTESHMIRTDNKFEKYLTNFRLLLKWLDKNSDLYDKLRMIVLYNL